MIRKIILLVVLSGTPFCSIAQSKIDSKTIKDKMQWFADAKLGIFIHAGIYSVTDVSES
jgi:alpha-L-fucosidase